MMLCTRVVPHIHTYNMRAYMQESSEYGCVYSIEYLDICNIVDSISCNELFVQYIISDFSRRGTD